MKKPAVGGANVLASKKFPMERMVHPAADSFGVNAFRTFTARSSLTAR